MPHPRVTPEMIRLYDRFTHETLDRRELMAGLTRLAGNAAAASAVLGLIAPGSAAAAEVEPGDPRISAQRVQWPVANSRTMKGYFAAPRPMPEPLPAVVVIHENRGLNAYVEDVARRLATAGFVALAPDFLTPLGGTPADEDQARQMIGKLDAGQTIADAVATLDWLRKNPRVAGKVGAVGFCWGGGLVNRIAVAAGDKLDAGVVFYGPSPAPAEAAAVKAPMMLHYAGLDDRVNATAPAWVDALEQAGVPVRAYTYDGANHAFHNDTSAARYDPTSARLAWDRSIAFFADVLKATAAPDGVTAAPARPD